VRCRRDSRARSWQAGGPIVRTRLARSEPSEPSHLKSRRGAPRYRCVKRRFLWLGLAALAVGVAVLMYRGPGRSIIRGHVGDVAATMLVYAVVGSLSGARIAWRAAATMLIATAIELGQLVWRMESQAGELLLGTTFDGWDLVAYAVGVFVAIGWELSRGRPRPRPDTHPACS
jgi:hypothetical protein